MKLDFCAVCGATEDLHQHHLRPVIKTGVKRHKKRYNGDIQLKNAKWQDCFLRLFDLGVISDDNELSYVNVKKWIKTQEGIVKTARLTERSRNGDISQKDKDKAMRTRIGAQSYIRSIKNYIQTGDWSSMYYGEFEDKLMGWVTVAPVGK